MQHYAWGSRTAIARLQGRPAPTARPEAELWIGAHPSAPSRLATDGTPLTEVIAAAPRTILGDAIVDRLGPRLPFLLKVLAADAPLSLQAHPSAEQAAAGYAAEEAAGVPVDAPERVYRDPWAKPELLCALAPVVALCGFRPVGDTLALLEDLDVDGLAPVTSALREGGADAVAAVVRDLLTLPVGRRGHLVGEVADAARRLAGSRQPFAAEAAEVVGLADRYPADPGVVVALLLNLIELAPGQAIHLPAGNLHTYLRGTGVEVMATSDNVLRGGLTAKHVDVEGLLDVLDTRPAAAPLVEAVTVQNSEDAYPTPTPQFRLSHLRPAGTPITLDHRGPQAVLCVNGAVEVVADGTGVTVLAGQAVLVTAAAEQVTVDGRGSAFRATAGELDG